MVTPASEALWSAKQNMQMNSARARALARATSRKLGADGHIVDEDGDLVLLMAERDRFKNVSHR